MLVRREIEERTGRNISSGAGYATVERLEAKGYVTSSPATRRRSAMVGPIGCFESRPRASTGCRPTRLTDQENVELLNNDDAASRAHILEAIYGTEQQLGTDPESNNPPPVPVRLRELQLDLSASVLFVEYVLGDPQSYALAVTRDSVHRYTLPSKPCWRWTANSTGRR
jgi:hypothetical protein